MFSMANKTKYEHNAQYVMSAGERYDIDATAHTVKLVRTPIENSISIIGMEQGTTAAIEKNGDEVTKIVFSVDGDTITFPENLGTDYVDVVYDYVQEAEEAIITNKEAAIGECVAMWPVYGSGDDCTESDIIGYWVIKVFRARITQVPGMDTSLTLRDAA